MHIIKTYLLLSGDLDGQLISCLGGRSSNRGVDPWSNKSTHKGENLPVLPRLVGFSSGGFEADRSIFLRSSSDIILKSGEGEGGVNCAQLAKWAANKQASKTDKVHVDGIDLDRGTMAGVGSI